MHVNYNPETVADLFDKLFRTYPSFQVGDGEEALRVYFEAVSQYDTRDIAAAVDAFLSGSAPGVNPNFAPPAPAVAAETRRQMNLRLDSEARSKAMRPALPPPDIIRTPESQARVRTMAKEVIANLASMGTDTSEADYLDRLRRTNEYFDREMQRSRGYTIGSPEAEEGAA